MLCRGTWLNLIAVISLLVAGCSTHAKRLMEPRSLFHQNQMEQCRIRLEKLVEHRQDRDVAALDLAMVDLVSGRPKQAEQRLQEIRDRFDYLEHESFAEKTLTAWTDDQVRSYAGEDYEKILIRAFLAISNLMHDGGDAESYSLQLNEKQSFLNQQAIERLGPNAFQSYAQVPMGYYIHGMIREATHRDYDDALKSYAQVCALCPATQPFQWDLQRAQTGVHSSPGTGVLYVFALVGRGPMKVEVAEEPSSDALLIADRIVSAVGPYHVPPTLAPIKVPQIVLPSIDVDRVGVAVDRQPVGPTESVANIERLALDTSQANHKSILARAVARRVLKKASIVAAKKTMGADNLSSLAMDAAGVVWEASESADTRCWGLLPRDIQVIRIELPVGSHQVSMTPFLRSRPIGSANHAMVSIVDGRNSYMLCCYPDSRAIGTVVVGP
jgi:uncharacterized protein